MERSVQSQTQKIYKALKAGRRLTSLSVFRLCGSLNAHKRVSEVERQYGIAVTRKPVLRNGKRLREYSL